MADPVKIVKAEIRELNAQGSETGKRVAVQFNPETLKLSFANQVAAPAGGGGGGGGGGAAAPRRARDQRGSSTLQFVGKGTTKLNVQLWFDVTANVPPGKENVSDVRELTKQIAYFITSRQDGNQPPPGVRFLWGSFKFDGIMDSLEESLEFFSNEGKPLRASVTLGMTQQGIEFVPPDAQNANGAASGGPGTPANTPGTKPLAQAPSGSNLQGLTAGAGLSAGVSWQDIASANNIENPRLLSPGQLIDLKPSVSFKVDFGS